MFYSDVDIFSNPMGPFKNTGIQQQVWVWFLRTEAAVALKVGTLVPCFPMLPQSACVGIHVIVLASISTHSFSTGCVHLLNVAMGEKQSLTTNIMLFVIFVCLNR